MSTEDLDAALGDPISFVGAAEAQVAAFVERVAAIAVANPEATSYTPAPIL